MSNSVLNTRIVLRHDTTENWLANATQVLLKGEIGIEFLVDQSVKLKIGDGVKPWSELQYFGGEGGKGVIVVGDGKTIKVDAETGTVSLYGVDGATTGQSPRIAADGSLEWFNQVGEYEVQTVLEATLASSAAAKASVEKIVTESPTVVEKINTIVDGKVSTVYKWKGSVQNYSELPAEDNQVGDTYNVVEADSEHRIKAGDNVVWDGSQWDNIGGYVDLSGYVEKTEFEPIVKKLDSMPTNIVSEVVGVNRTETGNTVDIKISKLDPDGTYVSETKVAAITLEAAGSGTDGKQGAGLMSLADKLKLDSLQSIKSSEDPNKMKINPDGTIEVNSISADKIAESPDVTLVLNGGNATATA